MRNGIDNRYISEQERAAHISGKYSMRSTLITASVGLVGIILTFILTHYFSTNNQVSDSIYERLSSEYEQLSLQHEELTEKYNSLLTENGTLMKEIAELKNDSLTPDHEIGISDDIDKPMAENAPIYKELWLEKATLLQYKIVSNYNINCSMQNIEGSVADNVGNRYSHGIVLKTANTGYGEDGHFVEYYLNKKYQSLTFTLALHEDSRDTKYSNLISIFADGNSVVSTTIASGFLPEEYTIDLTDVSKLKIEAICKGWNSIGQAYSIDSIYGNAILTEA